VETIIKPPEPTDYSLEDIEEVLRKIRRHYKSSRVPIPEWIQGNVDALR